MLNVSKIKDVIIALKVNNSQYAADVETVAAVHTHTHTFVYLLNKDKSSNIYNLKKEWTLLFCSMQKMHTNGLKKNHYKKGSTLLVRCKHYHKKC